MFTTTRSVFAGRPAPPSIPHFQLQFKYDPWTCKTTPAWVVSKEKVDVDGRYDAVADPDTVVGTRYCQHMHTYVPENLVYRVSGLAVVQKASVAQRLLTREFWHLPFAGEGDEVSQEAAGVPDRQVGRKGSVVRAEGLTHHQAELISLHDAQKNAEIKYRCLA